MRALLAALPILAILLLMIGLRWSAARAGLLGATAAAGTAILAFDFPAGLAGALSTGDALAGTAAEAAFTALTILWIIGPALGIHQLQLRTGAADVLRAALAAFAPDPRILALLIAWFFVLFVEGAAGFGASVALAAPFLVAAGFAPVQAVIITLTGHVVGVSFGAVGTPILPQMAATGASGLELARASGIYHSILGWLPLVAVVALVRRGSGSSTVEAAAASHGRLGTGVLTAAAFLCFVVPYTLLWAFVGPELPTLAGALFGGIAFMVMLAITGRRRAAAGRHPIARIPPVEDAPEPPPSVRAPAAREVAVAAAPYLVLVALVLATRLIPPLRAHLQEVSLGWELDGIFSGSMLPLYHPGSMLLAGFIAGALLQRAPWTLVGDAVSTATRRLAPVTVALGAMLLLSRLMVHAGMTRALADVAAASAASIWPVLAPFVGVLGTFVTGSATASNILFTDFQQETALRIGLPVIGIAGIQNFGAAVGNMVCPHNIVAAGATVGLAGREGEILRSTMWLALVYTTLGGVLALLLLG